MTAALFVVVALAQVETTPPVTPNPALTPGATLSVTAEQVCTPGYSRTVRAVSSADKVIVFERYGLHDTGKFETTKTGRTIWRNDFEVDHLIPLELGGSNAIENLWAESYVTDPWNAHVKDRLENTLHRMVCDGEISLADAQRAIATDWIAAYQKFVDKPTTQTASIASANIEKSATPSSPNPAITPPPLPIDDQPILDHNPPTSQRPVESQQSESARERHMRDFFLFSELPWLRRVLAYVIAFFVLWLAISVVAFLISPVIRRLRNGLRDFLDAVASRQRQTHVGRMNIVDAEIEQLRAAPHLRKSLRRSGESMLESDEVSGAFRPFFSAVQLAREAITDTRSAFDNLRDCLVQNNVVAADFQTAIPSASDIRADHNTKLREAVHLVGGLVFLLALMTVNTGMLSQILKDLEIVPTTLKFGNLQLYYVFGLLLTGAEAGTGILFGYLQQRVRRDAPATRLAPVFAVALALIIAFVEASFYSRVGGSSLSTLTAEDVIHIPGVDAQIPFSTVMFSWGFALVMLMFGSGMMIHNAATELTKDAGLGSLRRRLGKAARASVSVTEAMRVAEERQHVLLAKTQKVIETFTPEFAVNGSPDALLKLLTHQLKNDSLPPPVPDDKLSIAEMRELELRAVFWWWTALTSVALCVLSIQSLSTNADPRFGIGGAVAIFVLLAFGLGLDLSKQDIVAGLTVHAEHLGRRLFLRRAMRVLAVGVLCGLAGIVLWRPALVQALLPWFTVTATGTVVMFAGRELAPWFAFVVIHVRKLLNAIIWLIGKAIWLCLAVLFAGVVIVDAIVELAAVPMALLFPRKVQAQA